MFEEEVFTFGHKKRFHEKSSSAVDFLGTLMGYTRVSEIFWPILCT